ncbi:hypothetical protein HYPSUDRAFT_33047 [Hypholoma sublateritium FD-334 SS-4]|uniref:Microbial-type PARG catalytic domain-containing protein n=1 Tax=Hypholoma sublateritium (strain FD-334 SS-4) TaxID=945553 RepID=A0A0D2MXE1_HYPSF|nr:hypothetical protein HYPSUDRAFT_33047 [Hypholoma sublateritium FD-334 SS-4]
MLAKVRASGDKGLLREIATSTLETLEEGSYELDGTVHDLRSRIEHTNARTAFHSAYSNLSKWSGVSQQETRTSEGPAIAVSECSVLAGTRALKEKLDSIEGLEEKRVGVLNFASAKNPGGGFMTGAQAQEESIARSSTIYPSLMTLTAQQFYVSHRKDPKKGYYSHAMIYSPDVVFFRADNGDWLSPMGADIVTSAACNAGVIRRYLREDDSTDESDLDAAMKERMGRILYLFERHGVRNLVLGSFGTGVFRNRVELVAEIWKELLVGEGARFRGSFDRILFAILGSSTFKVFVTTFSEAVGENIADP